LNADTLKRFSAAISIGSPLLSSPKGKEHLKALHALVALANMSMNEYVVAWPRCIGWFMYGGGVSMEYICFFAIWR
jgi:hypothetical protein